VPLEVLLPIFHPAMGATTETERRAVLSAVFCVGGRSPCCRVELVSLEADCGAGNTAGVVLHVHGAVSLERAGSLFRGHSVSKFGLSFFSFSHVLTIRQVFCVLGFAQPLPPLPPPPGVSLYGMRPGGVTSWRGRSLPSLSRVSTLCIRQGLPAWVFCGR
jgi:hypothetical protein